MTTQPYTTDAELLARDDRFAAFIQGVAEVETLTRDDILSLLAEEEASPRPCPDMLAFLRERRDALAPHPLAHDPSVPACLRRLFARVTCKVVHRFDDGSESAISCTSTEQAEREAAESRALIGTGRFRPMPRLDGSAGPERRLVSVTIEPF